MASIFRILARLVQTGMTQLRGKLVYTNLRLFPFLSISADYGASIGTSILVLQR